MRTRADLSETGSFPRAPSVEEWSSLTAEEKRQVVASLGSMTDAEMSPPEGDKHLDGKMDARDTLREWFRRRGKSVYVGSEITTYYPRHALRPTSWWCSTCPCTTERPWW